MDIQSTAINMYAEPVRTTLTLREAVDCGRMRSGSNTGSRLMYRLMDITVAALILAMTMPVMVLIGLIITLDSRGPILFRQVRVGKNGRLFTLLKFRSMNVDAEKARACLENCNERGGAAFKMRCDPRVTRVGRIIRRLSLDELPQLINVLRGDMSLVGPRPALPSEVIRYTRTQQARLDVEPGLTGLWQISGRASLSFEEGVALDLRYIERRSPALNMLIIAKTIPAVLSGKGAY